MYTDKSIAIILSINLSCDNILIIKIIQIAVKIVTTKLPLIFETISKLKLETIVKGVNHISVIFQKIILESKKTNIPHITVFRSILYILIITNLERIISVIDNLQDSSS